MNADKKYITQLTRDDLQELAAVANLETDEFLVVDKGIDKVRIGINRACFSQLIQSLIDLAIQNLPQSSS